MRPRALDRRFHFAFFAFALLIFLAASTSAAFAQSGTGTLVGTVTDPQGAAVSGATVAVHNADTGVDLASVKTNETGSYTVSLLQPGHYDVTVSQTGFATIQNKGVVLQVGQT